MTKKFASAWELRQNVTKVGINLNIAKKQGHKICKEKNSNIKLYLEHGIFINIKWNNKVKL
jgi:hypothetical protein